MKGAIRVHKKPNQSHHDEKAFQRMLDGKKGFACRVAATQVMARVVDDQRGLDGVLETRHGPVVYQNLVDVDKALVRAIVTTALRHRGEIQCALDYLLSRKLPKNARHLHHSLHVAAAQILFMDVADHAAVDLAVSALRVDQRSQRFASLGNAILRRMVREKNTFSERLKEPASVLNMPLWMRKRVKKAYGAKRLQAICEHHMLPPLIDIVVKSDPEYWAAQLGGVPLFGKSVRIIGDQRTTKGPIASWPGYDAGHWWVQDAAASLPVCLLGDVKGKTVLDLCAAPGGKTAQLAHKGAKVTALEASQSRLMRLQENLQRLQLKANCFHQDMMTWDPPHLFDAVLLDAPCSSTGTIRRHPDVQWAKSVEEVERLAQLQKDMLVHAVQYVKPGGFLVFANCSIDRAEGEDLYAAVIKGDYGLEPAPVAACEIFDLEDCITGQGSIRSLPFHAPRKDIFHILETFDEINVDASFDRKRVGGLDGFFAARFKRK